MSETSVGSVALGVKPDTKAFGPLLKSGIGKATAGVGEHMGGIIKDGLKSMAGPIAAVTAAFGVKELIQGSIDKFESLAGSVNKIRRVTGGTVEQVSAMRGAMQLAGVDVNNIDGVMTRFAVNLGKAGKDAKSTAAMNQLFGQSIKDAHGNLKPMSDLLPGLADKFKEMPNGADKTALAVQLFGRQGAQLLPILNKGKDGIAELTGKAKDMGLVLDEAGIKKFAEAKKSQREFQATMDGLQVTMGEAFLPVMEGLVAMMRDHLIPIIKKVKDWFKEHQTAIENVGKAIKEKLQPVLETVIGVFKTVFTWVVQNRDILLPFVAAIGGVVVAFKLWMGAIQLWQAITKIAAVVQGVFNAVMAANPIMLLVLAIAALVAGLVYFFTQTKIGQKVWATFTKWLGGTITAIGKWFSGLWAGIVKTFLGVGDFFKSVFGGVGDIVKGYINIWIGLINMVIDGLDSLSIDIPSWVPGVGGQKWGVSIPNIPALAEGGVVPATPGGQIVRVAEAGQAEAVIPLDKLASMGAGDSRQPIMADGIGLIGWVEKSAGKQAKLVFAHEMAKVLGGSR